MDEQIWEIWKTTGYEILYVILETWDWESMQRAWVGVLMCEGCIEMDREAIWVMEGFVCGESSAGLVSAGGGGSAIYLCSPLVVRPQGWKNLRVIQVISDIFRSNDC